jgi:hypothetical protein
VSVTWSSEATGAAPEYVADDTKVAPIMYALADCLCEQLASTPGGSPCFCGVMPASLVPMDFCDCQTERACGMAWVRLDALYPSVQFPVQDLEALCGSPLAARLAVGVTRCLPTIDERGNPPDVAAQTMAVQVQMADMMAARRAIACCAAEYTRMILGLYTPIGPAGGCGGGFWTATFQVM